MSLEQDPLHLGNCLQESVPPEEELEFPVPQKVGNLRLFSIRYSRNVHWHTLI